MEQQRLFQPSRPVLWPSEKQKRLASAGIQACRERLNEALRVQPCIHFNRTVTVSEDNRYVSIRCNTCPHLRWWEAYRG